MKGRANEFVDRFPGFHTMDQTEQIVLLAYFHTVTEGRESVNRSEIEGLFSLVGTPVPKNLKQLLTYLASSRGRKLIGSDGEFSLRREVIKDIQSKLGELPDPGALRVQDTSSPFDFGSRAFADAKIAALLIELRKCYLQECWNACGLLVRIVIERTLDTVDPNIKAKTGLRDKINASRNVPSLSKSTREALDGLHNAKIIGDIAAHHSKIILDKPDLEIVLAPFRVLIKEVSTI
jgi:hypothetical protein